MSTLPPNQPTSTAAPPLAPPTKTLGTIPQFTVNYGAPQAGAAPQSNPLSKFFRQPAIYIALPSQGRYWPTDTLDLPENGEVGVYPMTSKDEITLRTPDALINGQGMVDVIQSCVPNIKNAWKMPATDVDAVLIAIRIASYGHSMDVDSICPHCNENHTYAIDLRMLLDTIRSPEWDQVVDIDQLIIKFMPQQYFTVNKNNKINFEMRKLQEAIDLLDDPDAKASEAVAQMEKMMDMNLETLAEATEFIGSAENPQERVYDKLYILEFYKNVNSRLVTKIQDKYAEIASVGAVKPQKIVCAGCNQEHETGVLFDYAAFFDIGS